MDEERRTAHRYRSRSLEEGRRDRLIETRMGKLVEFIAKSLVDHPEAVRVTKREEEDSVVIELSVDPEDTGKVIGKQGRIAKAIRSIVKAASVNDEKKVVVDIL